MFGSIAVLAMYSGCLFYGGFKAGRRFDLPKYELQIGEQIVNQAIEDNFSMPGYHLAANVTLPTHDGSTQIDHVLMTKYGIFVIETKYYTGLIFGNKDSKQWTQQTSWEKHKFQNPLRQNHRHIKELTKLLPFIDESHFYSLVVFAGNAQFRSNMPDNVMHTHALHHHIKQYTEEVITEDELCMAIGRIELFRKTQSHQTDIEHVEALQKRFG